MWWGVEARLPQLDMLYMLYILRYMLSLAAVVLCVLILQDILLHVCSHTTIYMLSRATILLYMCPHTSKRVCVIILL